MLPLASKPQIDNYLHLPSAPPPQPAPRPQAAAAFAAAAAASLLPCPPGPLPLQGLLRTWALPPTPRLHETPPPPFAPASNIPKKTSGPPLPDLGQTPREGWLWWSWFTKFGGVRIGLWHPTLVTLC